MSNTTMTYGNYRLSPAPILSIKTELNYSGENIIGYTHVLSLRGYATAYRRTDEDLADPVVSVIGLEQVLSNIEYIQNAFSHNGNDLSLYNEDNILVLRCKGGTLRSLNFNESPNNWVGYSEYNADIEFNEVEFSNGGSLKGIACSESFINSDSISSNIVDISKYKIKSFTDGWNISTDDGLYSRIKPIGAISLNIENSTMNISYSISATGKHFFIDGKLKPAWEHAKNFVQDRLHKQVTSVLTNVLGLSGDTSCAADTSIDQHGINNTEGLISNLNSTYNVYNETITCESSESDGTFSATYNAILKNNASTSYSHPHSKHTVSKIVTRDNSNRNNITISVQGTIEGLVLGGLIRTSHSGFSLPANGSILIGSQTIANKYSNAVLCLNQITNSNDLTDSFKSALDITYASLAAASTTGYPKPSSFNLTHDYHSGSINYTIEYNTNKLFGNDNYANITISVDNPAPVLAELNIPYYGVFIQDLQTFTAKRININIEGKTNRMCCTNGISINNVLKHIEAYIPAIPTYIDISGCMLIEKQRTNNLSEGTYNMTLGYVCADGCVPL